MQVFPCEASWIGPAAREENPGDFVSSLMLEEVAAYAISAKDDPVTLSGMSERQRDCLLEVSSILAARQQLLGKISAESRDDRLAECPCGYLKHGPKSIPVR